MKKRITILCLSVLVCCLVSGCQCEHQWTDATCTVPKTCTLCEITEGDALGHVWNAATCEAPETCSRCIETRGIPTDHIWVDPTCTTPKTCSVCATTEGQPLDHQAGGWEVTNTDFINAEITSKKHCNVCGNTLDRKTESLSTLHNGDYFLFSPNEFAERFNNKLKEFVGNSLTVGVGSKDNSFACALKDNTGVVGVFIFTDGKDYISPEQKYTPCISYCLGRVDGVENTTRALVAIIATCDPSLSMSEIKAIAVEVIENDSATENGITYIFSDFGDYAAVGFSIAG